MANTPGKVGYIFYVIFCGIPLTGLLLYGVYLYNYHDYGADVTPEFHANDSSSGASSHTGRGPAVPNTAPPPKISATVRLESAKINPADASGARVPLTAELLLHNEGPSGARMLYTGWPSPLIEVRIAYLGPDGRAKPEKLVLVADAVPHPPAFDPRVRRPVRHLMAVINPGDKFSVPVALVPPYDLSRPGKYSLEVQYDPITYCNVNSFNLAAMDAYALALTTPPIEFEVVAGTVAPAERKTLPAEPAKSAEPEKPAEVPPPAAAP